MIFRPVQHVLASMSREELKRLAAATGVPFHTLRKIGSGETPNPRIGTVEPIAQAIGISCKKAV